MAGSSPRVTCRRALHMCLTRYARVNTSLSLVVGQLQSCVWRQARDGSGSDYRSHGKNLHESIGERARAISSSCSTRLMLSAVHAPHDLCYQQFMLHTTYAISSSCSTRLKLSAVHAPHDLCYQQFMLHTTHAISSSCSTRLMLSAVHAPHDSCYQQWQTSSSWCCAVTDQQQLVLCSNRPAAAGAVQ